MLTNKVEQSESRTGSISFKLSQDNIATDKLKASLESPKAGALVCFEGIVRNHNDGKAVRTLEYEAYQSLAEKEAKKILAEASQSYSILAAVCVHRTGLLSIGETAVFVGVTSAHRDAAFQACRYIIDEIKNRLPIWKKESYEDGSSDWVNCQHAASETHADETHADEIQAGRSQLETPSGENL
ncbi:molybdenum cofactor biosynthesis protein MoaE [bacterium]|nr:molybdenum cofactor biosynthesis protein MoaE [bacterium]MBP9808202.1 molybdenum cofactor biosynthesis protein MoaE [bacterium]